MRSTDVSTKNGDMFPPGSSPDECRDRTQPIDASSRRVSTRRDRYNIGAKPTDRMVDSPTGVTLGLRTILTQPPETSDAKCRRYSSLICRISISTPSREQGDFHANLNRDN